MSKKISAEEAVVFKQNYKKSFDNSVIMDGTEDTPELKLTNLVGENEVMIEGFVFDNPQEIAESILKLGAKKLTVELGAKDDGQVTPVLRVVSEIDEADHLYELSEPCPPYCGKNEAEG